MAKKGTWADHAVVLAAARLLGRDIMIVTSAPDINEPDDAIVWVTGKAGFDGSPILLGHVHENHYVPVKPACGKFNYTLFTPVRSWLRLKFLTKSY